MDSKDFMNEAKIELFILKQTNNVEPMHWDLLDETRTCIMDHIVEDED